MKIQEDKTNPIFGKAITVICFIATLILCISAQTKGQTEEVKLIEVGEKLEFQIRGGAVKRLGIKGIASEEVHLRIASSRIQLVIDLRDEKNTVVSQIAIPAGTEKAQSFRSIKQTGGVYELVIRAVAPSSRIGNFTIERIEAKVDSKSSKNLEKARAIYGLAVRQLTDKTTEARQNAIRLFQQSCRLFLSLGEKTYASKAYLLAKVISVELGDKILESLKEENNLLAAIIETDDFKPGAKKKSSLGIDLVFVGPGAFEMGGNVFADEQPKHRVLISTGFWLGQFEVTQAQYSSIMGVNPSYFKACGGECPVDSVSWFDARKFIEKLNSKDKEFVYYLPSEAQWEYAAKSGGREDVYGKLSEIAWFNENSGDSTHVVGSKKPNSFTFYDLIGNVWEWVEDRYDAKAYSRLPRDEAPNVLNGNPKLRILRGGSWDEIEEGLRSSVRIGVGPEFKSRFVGFRLAARKRSFN